MFLGLILFVLFFVILMPQSQAFLLASATSAGAWITAWAPFSYLLLLIVLAAPFAGMHLIRSWPKAVEPEDPKAKFRKKAPLRENRSRAADSARPNALASTRSAPAE